MAFKNPGQKVKIRDCPGKIGTLMYVCIYRCLYTYVMLYNAYTVYTYISHTQAQKALLTGPHITQCTRTHTFLKMSCPHPQHVDVLERRAFYSEIISMSVFDTLHTPSGCTQLCSGRTAPTYTRTPLTTICSAGSAPPPRFLQHLF
jgi:hypothetical protein